MLILFLSGNSVCNLKITFTGSVHMHLLSNFREAMHMFYFPRKYQMLNNLYFCSSNRVLLVIIIQMPNA